MEEVLIDTDVIIDFLRGFEDRIKDLFLKIENKTIIPYLTFLNIVELYSGADAENPKKEAILSNLLVFFKIAELDFQTAEEAGKLRRKYQLGIVDSLIASTSLTQRLKLATFNKKHFQKIQGLRFYNF